jgi:gamma-glutamyltranspeptidase/glutathione hydrolase
MPIPWFAMLRRAIFLMAMLGAAPLAAQSPVRPCTDKDPPSWCSAVPGARQGGWLSQSRSELMARNGVVTTSHPLAAQAGLEILKRGGNAVDAAVATAAVLGVVEAPMTGFAGDLFAMIYVARERKVYALDASGTAPSGATVARFNALGYRSDPKNWAPGSGMPQGGVLSVTVPGAAWGWEEVLRRFGTLSLKETLQAAVDYAENGFPLAEATALAWELPLALPDAAAEPRGCCKRLDPDSMATWYVDGKRPLAGQTLRNRDMAKSLRLLQQHGRDVFYRGEIARAIVAKSDALGGTMTLADLAGYSGRWIEPARTQFRGHPILMLPPPAQTWAVNLQLNILEACLPVWAPGQSLATLGPANPQYWHWMVESKKLAYADLYAHNGDPAHVEVPLSRLLSREHARGLCGKVRADRAHATGRGDASETPQGDTIVLSTADRWGNMVAWVNSNYHAFGSGLTVPGYGFILHSRGALFSLDAGSPNSIAPGKRPFNTLSVGIVMRRDAPEQPLMTVTLMGGFMQAQGIAQVLVNVLELGANVQAASDMARFSHGNVSNSLGLEPALHGLVGKPLSALGHKVVRADGSWVGGYQAILLEPDPGPDSVGVYRAGSDHRKDGLAIGF